MIDTTKDVVEVERLERKPGRSNICCLSNGTCLPKHRVSSSFSMGMDMGRRCRLRARDSSFPGPILLLQRQILMVRSRRGVVAR